MRVFGRALPSRGSLIRMCITAHARSAWPVSSPPRLALKVTALPELVSAFLMLRKLDCRSIQPASNSMRPREKLCCAFITIWVLDSSEYSILAQPRTVFCSS